MAVLIRRRMPIDGVEHEVKTYQPSGRLSKEERERADLLDNVLSVRIPALPLEVNKEVSQSQGLVRKWYVLGRKLRALVIGQKLVSSSDVDSGLIWQAIWYYLPDSLKPADSADIDAYIDKQHKRKDHLSLCYELSAFDSSEVSWIRRWDDWNQLAFRPGLLRDPRIIPALGRAVSSLSRYPTREAFRNAAKTLGEAFPTRRHRDSSLLANDLIEQTVANALCVLSHSGDNQTQKKKLTRSKVTRSRRSA